MSHCPSACREVRASFLSTGFTVSHLTLTLHIKTNIDLGLGHKVKTNQNMFQASPERKNLLGLCLLP